MDKNKILIIIGSTLIGIIIGIIAVFMLKPKKEIISYQVIFETDGGTSVSTQTVKEGNAVLKPNTPTKEGYEFIEWLYQNKTYDFGQKVTSNLTLTAKWEEKETNENIITINFDSNGGTPIENQKIEKGKKITKPKNPVKEGYDFIEWRLDGKAYDFNTEVTKNIELVALWEKRINAKKFTITFNTNGGNTIPKQTVIEGNFVIRPKTPTKSGYTFSKWTVDGKTYDFNTKVYSNMEIIAVWKKNPSSSSSSTEQIEYITVPDVSGYTIEEAKKKIEELGFKYTVEVENSETVENGKVIETKPNSGTERKKGDTIIIVESIGTTKYYLENYIGIKYTVVKSLLESLGINVIIEKKDVENQNEYIGKEDIIIDQNPKYNTNNQIIKRGDTVTLYIPNIKNELQDTNSNE